MVKCKIYLKNSLFFSTVKKKNHAWVCYFCRNFISKSISFILQKSILRENIIGKVFFSTLSYFIFQNLFLHVLLSQFLFEKVIVSKKKKLLNFILFIIITLISKKIYFLFYFLVFEFKHWNLKIIKKKNLNLNEYMNWLKNTLLFKQI